MNIIIDAILDIIKRSGRDVSTCEDKDTQSYTTLSFFGSTYMRAKDGPQVKYIAIPNHLRHILDLLNITQAKPDGIWKRIYVSNAIDILLLSELIFEIYDFCELKAKGELFSCCSKYVECSDKKECLQKEEKWHKGCTYRVNLAKGKIFYGANSTIKI